MKSELYAKAEENYITTSLNMIEIVNLINVEINTYFGFGLISSKPFF